MTELVYDWLKVMKSKSECKKDVTLAKTYRAGSDISDRPCLQQLHTVQSPAGSVHADTSSRVSINSHSLSLNFIFFNFQTRAANKISK